MASNAQQICSALATTNLSTAATNIATVDGCNRHTLYIDWTPGVSGNILTILIQSRVGATPTNGTWTQETEWNENPAGTFTSTLRQLQHTASGLSLVSRSYTFEVHAEDIRLMITESDTGGAGKGTLTSYLLSSTY